jgi:hypothetical protein
MHPTLQRQLLRQLHDKTTNTYLIATHSAALLDTDIANVFRVDWSSEEGTTIELVSSANDRATLATSLGFRASDLVQANAIIWVEGPSDRIYLKRWLELLDNELVEGIHYSFVMYGGKLAEHLTALDEDQGSVVESRITRFLDITRINRHAIFVMDSDLTKTSKILARYKVRLRDEFVTRGNGVIWITKGVMIENYLDPEEFQSAYGKVHSRQKRSGYQGGLDVNPFAGGVKQPDKVGIAEAAIVNQRSIPDRGDLTKRLQEACDYIRAVNGMSARGSRISPAV